MTSSKYYVVTLSGWLEIIVFEKKNSLDMHEISHQGWTGSVWSK